MSTNERAEWKISPKYVILRQIFDFFEGKYTIPEILVAIHLKHGDIKEAMVFLSKNPTIPPISRIMQRNHGSGIVNELDYYKK